jgi:hypothetical protein
MALAQREPRKKYNPTPEQATQEAPLYLVTTGPAKSIWTMSTISNQQLVELMPVFDTEEHVRNLLADLQDKSYQAAMVSLTKLSSIVKERNVLFILNPNIKISEGQMCLKEGPNWHLPLDKLNDLLSTERSNSEEKVAK